MMYNDYAPQINTGDLISIPTAHSWLGKATQFFTRKKYTHSGLAMWLGGELFMAELNGGRNHLVPILQLKDFDVHECPPGLQDIDGAIRQWLSYPVPYGFIAFVAIGLLNWLQIKLFVKWRNILVCSGYCVAIYQTAGWTKRVSRVISPGHLADELVPKLTVRMTT